MCFRRASSDQKLQMCAEHPSGDRNGQARLPDGVAEADLGRGDRVLRVRQRPDHDDGVSDQPTPEVAEGEDVRVFNDTLAAGYRPTCVIVMPCAFPASSARELRDALEPWLPPMCLSPVEELTVRPLADACDPLPAPVFDAPPFVQLLSLTSAAAGGEVEEGARTGVLPVDACICLSSRPGGTRCRHSSRGVGCRADRDDRRLVVGAGGAGDEAVWTTATSAMAATSSRLNARSVPIRVSSARIKSVAC